MRKGDLQHKGLGEGEKPVQEPEVEVHVEIQVKLGNVSKSR